MELRCSCGASPPSDARFCHKCGRPLFEQDAELIAEAERAAQPVPIPVIVAQPVAPRDQGISFRNMRAVGVTIAFAAVTFFCIALFDFALPGVGAVGAPLLLAGGGFAATVVYAKQSRQALSGASGARLGWMTGLWFFLGFLVIATVMVAIMSGPAGAEVLRQMQERPQFANLKFPNPSELASLVLKSSVEMFFLAILFPIFGGIAGARFTSRNRPSA